MSRVLYNSKRIVPAPFIQVSKEYHDVNGEIVGAEHIITITGKLLPDKGSPSSTGVFHTGPGEPADESISGDSARFKSIVTKQDALRGLFGNINEGGIFEHFTDAGDGIVKASCRLVGIDFPSGEQGYRWRDACDYTVTLATDDVVLTGGNSAEVFTVEGETAAYIRACSIDYSIEEVYDGTSTHYLVTHSISATGKRSYVAGSLVQEAYLNAKDFVTAFYNKTDLNDNFFLKDLTTLSGYIQNRSESINRVTGEYTLNVTYLFNNQNYVDTFTVSTDEGSNGISVTVEGEIRGLGDDSSTRWTNANAAFSEATILTRAQNHSGITGLNVSPLNKTKGKNITSGVLTYSYTYDKRPSHLISGSLSESISISEAGNTVIIAEIFVLGRINGPVLQDLGATTVNERTVTIDLVMPPASSVAYSTRPDTNSLLTSLQPTAGTVYKIADSINWNPINGSYSRSATYHYE